MRFLFWSNCLLIFFFGCLLASVPAISSSKYKPVLLKEIHSLVFTKDAMTTARRSSSIPQMICVKGPCQYAPTTAFCKNIGFDGVDVNWQCEAELPKGVRLASATVSCEGFAHSDDPYILAGSCGLEYSLEGAPLYSEEVRNPLPQPVPSHWWHHPIASAKNAAHKAATSVLYGTFGWFWDGWNWPRGAKADAQPTSYYGSKQPRYPSYPYAEGGDTYLFPSSLGGLICLAAVAILVYSMFKSWFPSTMQPPPYDSHHKVYSSQGSPRASKYSGFLQGLIGGALGYFLGSRREPASYASPSSWGPHFGSSRTAQDSFRYAPQEPTLNPRFPPMRSDESPSAPVNHDSNIPAGPGERTVSERSVIQDQALAGTEVNTKEVSKTYGTTKRR